MPEGPEVEVVRQGLLNGLGSKILQIKISSFPKYKIEKTKIEALKGHTIENISRRGKFLIWEFTKNEGKLMGLNHLGMTGIWHIYTNNQWNEISAPFTKFKHFKVYFALENNIHLIFIDIRTFGRFQVLTPQEIEEHPSLKNLGPDILDNPFNLTEFILRIKGKKRPRTKEIGQLLLDPNIIAGCGNIYKSESLHRAKIHPMLPANKMNKSHIKELGIQLSNVAQEALKNRGSTLKNYQDVSGVGGYMQDNFRVYDREGDNCQNCSEKIIRGKHGGRTSYWCPKCQILPTSF